MTDGPAGYANWRAFDGGEPGAPAFEYAIHTDAIILGEVRDGLGPYKLFNTVAHGAHATGVRLGLVLRMDEHLGDELSLPDWASTNVEQWAGLALDDEIAVLLSLTLGIRARGGGAMRWFRSEEGADPLGEPVQWERRDPPALPVSMRRPQIPRLDGQQVNVADSVPQMSLYPKLDPVGATRLLRAAGLYRNALWLADADPSQAWLFLVSAVETVAQDMKAQESSMAVLEEHWPEMAKHAKSSNADKAIVYELAQQTRATMKFVKTVLKCLPPPPESRPPPHAQVDWDNMESHLKKIYKWRSKAHHEGIAMPQSMCFEPYLGGDRMERLPNAMSSGGGVWTPEDSPMLLHTFEYIARGTLLQWWADRAASASTP